MPIQKIGILGSGQMGAGIAQVAALGGFEVVLRDMEDRFLVKGLAAIDQGLATTSGWPHGLASARPPAWTRRRTAT